MKPWKRWELDWIEASATWDAEDVAAAAKLLRRPVAQVQARIDLVALRRAKSSVGRESCRKEFQRLCAAGCSVLEAANRLVDELIGPQQIL